MPAESGPEGAHVRRRRGGQAAPPPPPPPAPPPVPPEPPPLPLRSGVDSSTLQDRSVHDGTDQRRTRRRRSALRRPALVSPMDVPEDADGRVEFIVVRAPADCDEPPPDVVGAIPTDRATEALSAASGWIAVAVLGLVLIVIFLAGYVLVR